MPRYDFVCPACQHRFETIVTYATREESIDCPQCNAKKSCVRQVPECSTRGPIYEERELIRRKHGSTIVDEKIEHRHMLSTRSIFPRPNPLKTRRR